MLDCFNINSFVKCKYEVGCCRYQKGLICCLILAWKKLRRSNPSGAPGSWLLELSTVVLRVQTQWYVRKRMKTQKYILKTATTFWETLLVCDWTEPKSLATIQCNFYSRFFNLREKLLCFVKCRCVLTLRATVVSVSQDTCGSSQLEIGIDLIKMS